MVISRKKNQSVHQFKKNRLENWKVLQESDSEYGECKDQFGDLYWNEEYQMFEKLKGFTRDWLRVWRV